MNEAPKKAAQESVSGSTNDVAISEKCDKATIDYREVFFEAHPELKGQVIVHHAIEQQILTRYPGLFTEEEIHSLGNLRGIPKSLNNELHLSKIRKEWNNFYRQNPSPTRENVIAKAIQIDKKYGKDFKPPII